MTPERGQEDTMDKKTMAKFVIIILASFVLAGCAPMPPKEALGQNGEAMERLANATTFVAPPPVETVRGFEIALPQDVAEQMGCKEYPTIDKAVVQVCRKSFRARLDGREASAYPFGGKWYVFGIDQPSRVEILSARGASRVAPVINEIGHSQVTEIYADIASTFPSVSGVIPGTAGTRLLYGQDVLDALRVPSLVDWKERAAMCGLGSVSSTELIGVATGNPLAAVGKVLQGVCALRQESRLLVGSGSAETQPGDTPQRRQL